VSLTSTGQPRPRKASAGSERALGSALAVALGLGSALGCSAGATSYTSDADHGTTQALITIERRQTPGAVAAQAEAFASFVRTPPEVDPSVVTRVTGLDLGLPELGECAVVSAGRDGSLPLSPLRRVELLDAGDVALETASGRVELARRAFPAVTDLMAGVVYTTRDQSADLPAASSYSLSVAGSDKLPALALRADAPPGLDTLSLDGLPLAAGARLEKDAVLTWSPGAERDLVYVAIVNSEIASTTLCTFRDSAGQGVLSARALPPAGPGTLSVHRLRSISLGSLGAHAGELRFDFETYVPVEIARAE
jgi:hypothetical protein